jgi:hypothetical protein
VYIIESDGATYTIDAANCDGSVDPALSSRTCRIEVAVLRAAPYSYPWGTSVYVKVTATNIKGTSELSLAGNGAVIIFSPDAPTDLIEDVSQRTASSLGI